MAIILDSDFFQVESSATQYKVLASDIRDEIKSYDYLGVSRAGTDYRLADDIRFKVKYDDSLAVNRSGVDYKVSGEDYLTYLWKYPLFPLAINQDENYSTSIDVEEKIVIGSPAIGNRRIVIYDLDGTNPIEVFTPGVSDNFGRAVAVGEGKIVVCGATVSASESLYTYDIDGTNELQISNDTAGASADINDGRIYVGGRFSNVLEVAEVYDLNGNLQYRVDGEDIDPNSEGFGNAGSISDGYLCVGGAFRQSGRAYILNLSDGSLISGGTLFGESNNDRFGEAVAAADGMVVIGAPFRDEGGINASGAAYVHDITNGSRITKIVSPNPTSDHKFGNSVSIGSGRIVIGGDNNASVYVYDYNFNLVQTYTQPATADDTFGNVVSVGRCNGRIVIGNPGSGSGDGAAYFNR